MKTYKVYVTHHQKIETIYEIQAENEWYLDEALKDNSPADLGKCVYEEAPVETHIEITKTEEV